MTDKLFHLDLPVATALERWPRILAAFVGRGMACPGCDMAAHMSLAEAAEAYELDAKRFESDLRGLIDPRDTARGAAGTAPDDRRGDGSI